MKLLNFINNNLFLQNFAASIVSYIPPFLEFSVAKYIAIKKAMYITAVDQTYGSYMEFGVFTGSSFNFAMKINKQLENKNLTKSETNKLVKLKHKQFKTAYQELKNKYIYLIQTNLYNETS